MTFVRDFFRRRRLRRHVERYGWRFDFHGRQVSLPELANPGFANALLRGKYEKEEAELISRYLPSHSPVIELGGSLGIVSGLIRSHLEMEVRHVVVEANPGIIDFCSRNAAGEIPGATSILNGALAYDTEKVCFPVSESLHTNRLGATHGGETAEVDAYTLAQLWEILGKPLDFTLVSDIEGAELEMVRREPEILSSANVVIMELHPVVYPQGRRDESHILKAMDELGFYALERMGDVVAWRKLRQA